MSFWDDLIKTITGQSSAPAKKTADPAPARKAPTTQTVAPSIARGTSGGGARSFSLPTQVNSNPDDERYMKAAQQAAGRTSVIDTTLPNPITGENTLKGPTKLAKGEVNVPAEDPFVARQKYLDGFGIGGPREVRQLTDGEWAGLSPEQQKGVLTSWAIFQAAQEDKALASTEKGDETYQTMSRDIFGEDGGSDTYAPATLSLLNDLGYKTDRADLDNFLDNSALITYDDLMNTEGKANTQRLDLFNTLANNQVFAAESVVGALQNGEALLDTVRTSGAVPQSLRKYSGQDYNIDSTGQEELFTVMKNLADRELIGRMETEEDLNKRVIAQIDELNAKYGPDIVSRYFRDSIKGVQDTTNFLTPEEFNARWLEG